MNYTQADHIWFIERIEAYLGGGLSGDELARFEAHAANCLPCEAKLGDGSRTDAALREIFAAHRPATGLEGRVIGGVRTSLDQHRPRLLNPKVRRAASVVAAGLLLSAMGYVGKLAVEGGSLSRFNPGRLIARSPAEVIQHLRGDATRQPPSEKPSITSTSRQQRHDSLTGKADDADASVRTQLDRRVPELNFNGNSLTDVIDFMRDVSGSQIDVNWKTLEQAGISKDTPVNLKLRDKKMSEVLPQILASAGNGKASLSYTTSDGVIHISTAGENLNWHEATESPKAVASPVATAQAQIRDGKYQEALGTIDQILKTSPNDDYAKGVRPLVSDKLALAQTSRGRLEFESRLGRSVTEAGTKPLADGDVLRYPPNWPDISEVRDATVRQDWNPGSPANRGDAVLTPGYAYYGGQRIDATTPGVQSTVTVPDGGTLLLGGQTITENTKSNSDPAIYVDRFKESAGALPALQTTEGKGVKSASIAGGATLDLNGGALVVTNGSTSSPEMLYGAQRGFTHGLTKSGNGTIVLNGENAYGGGTTVTSGTLQLSTSAVTTNDRSGATATKTEFRVDSPVSVATYKDLVPPPKPAESQHTKLAEVATVDESRQHATDRYWNFQTTDGAKVVDGTKGGSIDSNGNVVGGDPGVKLRVALGDGDSSGKDQLKFNVEAKGKDKETDADGEHAEKSGAAATNLPKSAEAVDHETGLNRAKSTKGDDTATQLGIANKTSPGQQAAATDGTNASEEKVRDSRTYEVKDLVAENAQNFFPNDVNPTVVAQVNPTAPATGAAAPQPQVNPERAPVDRKIIRNGDVIFEVDSFDSSQLQIGKIVTEEGGYVSTTDSEKLPNGKVKGTITVRVPPEHLDVLVLKLRGLGDLKNQRIAAQDVTKQFVDSESQLKANRAMEQRLLDLIKNGKGEVKDLVAAEKQLGVYREKIEQIEGELRYMASQVAMSTLNITLFERDIKTPTAASESETVDAAIETEEVEKARADALKAIDDVKGRVIESQMKRFEAGQLQATITAEVAPENAGAVTDRLKMLGRMARFDVERKQTTTGGQGAPVGLKLEKKPTVFKVSIYNLANIAPRETVNISLACEDVEKAYKAILAAAEVEEVVNGVTVKVGRVVNSSLNSQRADQTTGTISIEVRSDRAAAVETAIRAAGGPLGEMMHLTVTENPDANNVTRAKRGYSVSLASLASVAPRETEVMSVAAKNVTDLYQKVMARLQDGKIRGHIYASRMGEQNGQNVDAFLDFEVPRTDVPAIEALFGGEGGGDVMARNSTRSTDTLTTLDSKLRLQVTILNVDRISARETAVLSVAAKDVPALYRTLMAQLQDSPGGELWNGSHRTVLPSTGSPGGTNRGHVFASRLDEQDRLNIEAFIDFEIPRGEAANIEALLNGGTTSDVFRRNVTRSTDVLNTLDSKVRMQVSILNIGRLRPREESTLTVEVADPERALLDVQGIANAAGGHAFEPHLNKDEAGKVEGKVAFDVPLAAASATADKLRSLGTVRESRSLTNESVPSGNLAKARFEVTLVNASQLIAANRGVGARMREGVRTSVDALLLLLEWVIVIAPFVLVLWLLWKLFRRGTKKPSPAVPAAT